MKQDENGKHDRSGKTTKEHKITLKGRKPRNYALTKEKEIA